MTISFGAIDFVQGIPMTDPTDLSVVPAGNDPPQGALTLYAGLQGTDTVVSSTYDGESQAEVSGSPVLKSSGEVADLHAFFVGSGLNSGTVNNTMDFDATAQGSLFCITLDGATDLEIVDVVTISSDSVEDPSDTLSLGGRTCYCALAFVSGQGTIGGVSPLTNWTSDHENSAGGRVRGLYTYDIVGSSDVTVGAIQTPEIFVMIAVAVSEVAAGGAPTDVNLTGTGRGIARGVARGVG